MNNPKKIFPLVIIVSICSIVSLMAFKPATPLQKKGVRKVVIDAGHGGSDNGARGTYSNEKDIALAVALKLEQLINASLPDVEIYMTRTTDVFDNVKVKANKANDAKGDLFISIHCNDAAPRYGYELTGYTTQRYKKKKKWYTKKVPQYRRYIIPSTAKGTETYIWGIDKNDDKERALRENESMYKDSTLDADLRNFDPYSEEQMIAISLRTQQYAERSKNLAYNVEDEFIKIGRASRDVRQRGVGIWVLQAVAMPAILVELGFLSNLEEENYLNSQDGQEQLAACIARAVKKYKEGIEQKMTGSTGSK